MTTLDTIQTALQTLDPQFRALRATIGALKSAERLSAAATPDALPMHKALARLEAAAAQLDHPAVTAAVQAFADDTQSALDGLAFDFAGELRAAFAARQEAVGGRPPTLTVGLLTLTIDVAARKAQWLYGREALTGSIPLSLAAVLKAYDQQVKRIAARPLDAPAFLQELHKAWQDCVDKRKQRPQGGRISIVEAHSQMTINRQNARFWNAPSRRTFKDYERELFVRDMVLLREGPLHELNVEGRRLRLRLGVATKSQSDQASRSMWLPESASEGQYYADIFFE
jgi:hypothetical protein